ncbi:ATP-binding protein [Streptomyces luteolus]|uniref:ATP-binding protein n=1 Tax=Streptomyces luteolus TaxID=3043615 RepID=UPI0038D04F69
MGRARRFVREAIAGRLPADRTVDVAVCVSELATNALRHTPPGRQFRVRLAVSVDKLRLEVHDAGEGKPQLREPAEDDDHGPGLLLVAALADDWGTAPRDGAGKLVWAEFKLAAARQERETPGGAALHTPSS